MTTPAELLRSSLASDGLLLVVLSRPQAGADADKVSLRPVTIRGARCYQLSRRVGPQEHHENLSPKDVVGRIDGLFREQFDDCHIYTSDADAAFQRRRDGSIQSEQANVYRKDR